MKRAALLVLLVLPFTVFADAGVPEALDAGASVVIDAGVLEMPALPVTAPVPPNLDGGDFLGFLKAVHSAVLNKEWGSLIFFAVTLLVFLSRKFFEKKVPALASPIAAVIKSFLLAFSGMLATTWGGGLKPTFADVMTAVQVGFAAAGGWSILKAVVEAAAKKWDWARWLLGVMGSAPKAAEAPAVPPVAPVPPAQ